MTSFTPYSGSVPTSSLTGSCLLALVDKGLVKLGNFGRNPNKPQYAHVLTPAGMEEKTRITLTFLRRKEAEFESIRRGIAALTRELQTGCGKQEA